MTVSNESWPKLKNGKIASFFRKLNKNLIVLEVLRYLLKNFAFGMSMFFQEALLYDPKSKMFQMASEPDEFRSGFFQRH